MFVITKVVSRNLVIDVVAKLQNVVGKNLKGYEQMIQRGTKQIQDEMTEKGIKPKWYHYQVTQLTNGAIAIMCYGDEE